jgi:hypothetical protein
LESDGKPRFKEAFNKIRFATSSLAWNFNKRLPDLSRSVYLSYLSLLPPVFSRLDLFCALGFLLPKIEVTWLYYIIFCITDQERSRISYGTQKELSRWKLSYRCCIHACSAEDYWAVGVDLLRGDQFLAQELFTFVPRIRYLGFTTRGKKGPLTTTGDLSACKSK